MTVGTLDLRPRRVTKNAINQFVAYGLSWGGKAVAAAAVGRMLGREGLGSFMLFWTVASILSEVAVFGLDNRLVRELNRGAGRSEIGRSLMLAVVLSAGVTVLMVAGPAITGSSQDVLLSLCAAGLYVLLSAPILITRATFHARERMELETWALGTDGVVGVGAVLAILAVTQSVWGALGGLCVGRLANLVVSLWLRRRLWGTVTATFQTGLWPAMLRVSVPMSVAYLFNTLLLRFDIVLVGILRGAEETGIYAAAALITSAVPVLATSVNRSLYPVLSRARGAHDPELRRITGWLTRMELVAGTLVGIAIAGSAGLIISMVYGDAFRAAVPVLVVLAAVVPLRFVSGLYGFVLNATDLQSKRAAAVGAAALFNLVTNLALIPILGYWGAVWSTLGTEILLALLLFQVLGRAGPVRDPKSGVAVGGAHD